MVNVAGIQLEKNGKIYTYDAGEFVVKAGDFVIVDTVRGIDLGEVVIGNREADENAFTDPLRRIIRMATEQDLARSTENRQHEREAYAICQKKIAEHKLDMKLVSVEYTFDNSKILFYFTANGRVDFRSLVKDLAAVFKMRIELRQIGVRDEARMLGGLGPCGRQICCGAFLDDFQPVSIKMAKEQNLSLNPTKISGVCGRLMCCLKYEQDHYEQTRKKMPRVGREVMTPEGKGVVTELNIVKETVTVRITNGDSSELKEFPMEQVSRDASTGSRDGENSERNIAPDTDRKAADNADENAETTEAQEEELQAEEEFGNDAADKETAPEKRNGNDRRNRGSNSGIHNFSNNKRKQRNNSGGNMERQLGKPVMRENPNKTKESGKAEENAENATKADPAPMKRKNENWAEQLKKAMDAIQ